MVNFLRDVMIAVAILATLVAVLFYPGQDSTSHAGTQAPAAHAHPAPAASASAIGDGPATSFDRRQP